jgi:hypothetical protein
MQSNEIHVQVFLKETMIKQSVNKSPVLNNILNKTRTFMTVLT